ncbi:CoA-binding protein [soil metagenome]
MSDNTGTNANPNAKPNAVIALLQKAKTIAVVGLSAKPSRASHEVAAYLQTHGYRILPVNPNEAGKRILNELCYASLSEAVMATGLQIDIVDCFRKAQDIPVLVDEAIALGAGSIWMQLGVRHEQAAQRAMDAGLQVVMDKCPKIEHRLHLSHRSHPQE